MRDWGGTATDHHPDTTAPAVLQSSLTRDTNNNSQDQSTTITVSPRHLLTLDGHDQLLTIVIDCNHSDT